MLLMRTSPAFSSSSLTKDKQPFDANLMRQNLKSPISPNELLKKYSPDSQLINKSLPARFSQHPIYGELLIEFQSIMFMSNFPASKAKHIIYRCRMLGYSTQQLPFLSKNITYTIHTNNKMFKHYLKDMKICLVEVLDARNYEPIGHCYVNWLTHMKSIEDNQPLFQRESNANKYEENPTLSRKYYLPFLDQQCAITLPVFDYKNGKIASKSPIKKGEMSEQLQTISKNSSRQRVIGQIQLRFMSRIYEQPIAKGYGAPELDQQSENLTSNKNHQNPSYQDEYSNNRINPSPSYLQIPQGPNSSNKNMISIKSLSPSNKMIGLNNNNHDRFDSFGQNDRQQPETFPQLRRQHSNHSAFNQEKHSNKSGYHNCYKVDGSGINSRIYSRDQNKKSMHNNNNRNAQNDREIYGLEKFYYRQDKSNKGKTNDLQLLQLKLEVQQFFKGQKLLQNSTQKQQKVFIQIIKLKSKLQNITQLDVFLNQNEEQLYAQTNNKQNAPSKPHIKIYKISTDKLKNQDFFRSQIIVQRPSSRIIEIHLPNNQGKCVFRCKDLTATQNEICVYNKGVIMGVLSVKKESERKQVLMSHLNVSPFLKQQNKQGEFENGSVKNLTNQDKICIVVIQNFAEQFYKKSQLNDLSHLDNYSVLIKGVQFFHETLNNSKTTGQYAVVNSKSIPKVFVVQVKNSSNQLVGMSENVTFEGNEIKIMDQNLMPTLILQRNLNIHLKEMPVFKKLPNGINLTLSMYVANTNQLNYFINKWKQNANRNRMSEVRKQRSLSNAKQVPIRQTQKVRSKQYTISDQVASETKYQKRIKTESQNDNLVSRGKYRNLESRSSNVRQSGKERFNTQGNYTEDLNNEAQLEHRRSEIKEQEQHYSYKDGQQQEQIYLVEFFCKSLHYVLFKLGSKKIIEQKITQLGNYQYTKRTMKSDQPPSGLSQEIIINDEVKGLVSKDQFERILSILVGQNSQKNVEILGFDVKQILEALFIMQDGEFIRMQQFTLCLMAYYNFMLLLTNQKLNALKQVLVCEPEVDAKLSKIQESMTNINSQFLWEDVLPNVIQKTKQKVNKRYRVYPNTPFSVNFLLKDLILAKNNAEDTVDEALFRSLLNILTDEEDKKYEKFIRTTADMGNLVRQTVEEIIFAQCTKSSNLVNENQWIQTALMKIDEFVQKQNLESISSDDKDRFCFNLTQFQQFFSSIGIETSIWESLMLIEEIKVWHQGDEVKDKEYFQTGQGIIAVQLIKSWLNALSTKIEIKNQQKALRKQINTKSSRLNSMKSIDSDEEDVIERMNTKAPTNKQNHEKQPYLNKGTDQIKQGPKSPINRVVTQQNESIFNRNNSNYERHKKTERYSLKESQSVNNESDIVNIANLLKQHENNLYFLPSLTEQNNLNKVTLSNNQLFSNSNILRGLEQNSLRSNFIESLPTRKTNNLVSANPDQQKRRQQQYLNGSEVREEESDQSKVEEANIKQKIEPFYGYFSMKIREIKLKRNQIVVERQGLKKLVLSLKKNLNMNQNSIDLDAFSKEETSTKFKQHYFLTQQTVNKVFSMTNGQSFDLLKNYSLDNVKVDINNLYEFETQFGQGISIQLMNLIKLERKQSQSKIKKTISTENKVEELTFSGILPIEDITKLIEQYKGKFSGKVDQKELDEKILNKKKTIVLYRGRQIVGKAVVYIAFRDKETSRIKERPIDEVTNITKISFSYIRKELFTNQSKLVPKIIPKSHQPSLMSLSYCSIRDQQKTTQLLPSGQENTNFLIYLPEPVLEYQLILRTVEAGSQKVTESNLLEGANMSELSLSQFTRFDKDKTVNGPSNKSKQQCVIPLETLYFKKTINEEYPLIDQQTGRFISTILVKLEIAQQKVEEDLNYQKAKTLQSEQNEI